MNFFELRTGELFAEGCTVQTLAETYGTPLYIYSRSALETAYQAYAHALGDDGMICYAVKANSNIAVLNVLARMGAGFDIVSKGELQRVLAAGGDPRRVVFSGLGKTRDELLFALQSGVHCINLESAAELEALAEVCLEHGFKAKVSLRVNPDVDAKTHPYISTGLKENKFGIDILQAPAVYRRASSFEQIEVVGIDCHIGSQLTETRPFLDAIDRLLVLIDQLAEDGISIQHLDLGGGLGVRYQDETPPTPAAYIQAIKQHLGERKLKLIFEPGRSIAANAGILVSKVEYLKPSEHKNFAIIDAAMNDMIRPSLYSAWMDLQPVKPRSDVDSKLWDAVGPVCETGDFLAKDRQLALAAGDYLALFGAGAYGFTMASNYNSRGRAAEVMVDGDSSHLIRQREDFEDMIRGEQLLP
ncbi:diaminopimelate decarboxylase [Sinobacterium caligoides]|uniref:Diaminopimelate decarboxylase n=1 Tax=Sinobacterium caligoides TaxID=933926 RepID=A0A3N2DQD2_9GAMM|nr:diaminopimelate decarboxylase [Sinobacterium caligoides]ROS02000.1 diaminopimelate decarboxylase [Sinobacterium caligoides]